MESAMVKASLDNLRRGIRDCKFCKIVSEAKTPTPFRNDCGKTEHVWVGRNPGIQERDVGEPFVGKTKSPMDKMIDALGLTREEIHITNVVKCYTCYPRPDRPPTPEECKICGDRFLRRELDMLEPRVVVTWGKDAVRFVSNGFIPTCRGTSGKPYTVPGVTYIIFPMEHPGVLIRNAVVGGKPISQKMEEDFAQLYLLLKDKGIL